MVCGVQLGALMLCRQGGGSWGCVCGGNCDCFCLASVSMRPPACVQGAKGLGEEVWSQHRCRRSHPSPLSSLLGLSSSLPWARVLLATPLLPRQGVGEVWLEGKPSFVALAPSG